MGLMDMFGKKSQLVDCQTYLSNIQGTLSGDVRMTPDGDFSVWFVPDNKSYLLNRNKVQNPNGMLELKVKVDPKYKQAFLDAVQAMVGQPVFASGVLINDDSQAGKAQVHPLDMLYAPLPSERYPGWFKAIQQNLKDPNSVSVHKIAAASDASKSNKPPQADETRAMRAFFSYPPKPNLPKIKIDFEVRKIAELKAEFQMNNETMKQRIALDLSLESAKKEGPGVFVGDFVAYWGNE